MTRPRVFAVQQPTGRDGRDGSVRPTMDLSPAGEFGDLCYILGETENPFRNATATARRVHNYLMERAFGPDDFLLLVGNPILIALVSAVAAAQMDTLNVLQWDRSQMRYRPVSFQLPDLAA